MQRKSGLNGNVTTIPGKENKMKRNTLILTVAIVAVLALSTVSLGKGHQAWGSKGYCNQADVPENVKLTQEQTAKISDIRDSYAGQFADLNSIIRDLNAAVDNELAKDAPNADKVRDLRSERSETFNRLRSLADSRRADINNVLTDEQKEYFGESGCFHCQGLGQGYHHGWHGKARGDCPRAGSNR